MANDTLVNLFLLKMINFTDITNLLLKLINMKEFKHYNKKKPGSINSIIALNDKIKTRINELIK